MRRVAGSPFLLTVALLCSMGVGPSSPGAVQESAGRIDDELREHLREANGPVPVFVLLREQSGLDESSYRSRPRLSKEGWRRHVIEHLQALSTSAQDAMLRELEAAGHRVDVDRRFWIVNGVALGADAEAVRWLAGSGHAERVFLRAEKPADLIATEGRFTQAYEQREPGIVSLDEVLAHDDLSWNLRRIQADLVWSRLGLLGRGAVIAILDSGVNYRHSDIRHHLWRNDGEVERNGIDDDGNGYVDDIYGFNFANRNSNVDDDFFHGTSSASIMVGDGRGGMLTGVAPGAELMVLRMYDQMTRHSNSMLWQAYQYDAWEALEYAVREGAHVINMSFAWEPAEKPLHAAWRIASTSVVAAGVVMVAGAGNFRGSYPIPGQIRPPASVPAVIATGGVFENGTAADLTSRGPVTWTDTPPFDDYPLPEGLPQVAFSAPWGYFPVIVFRGRGYQVLAEQRGSSLTSPHVAGVVALMLEDDPELMPDEVRDRLARTSLDVAPIGTDPYTGAGMVQAYDAIMAGSLAQPRVTAVRYRAAVGAAEAATLRPGSGGTIELDVENAGRTGEPAIVLLEAEGDDVELPEPRIRLGRLDETELLRFPFRIADSATPGATTSLRLTVRAEPGTHRSVALELPIWGGELLLVDDDGGGDYEREWQASLERQGIGYDLLSAWPAPRVPLPELTGYRAVVWVKGEEAYRTLDEEQRLRLGAYRDAGGRLLLVGQNVARDLADTAFLGALGARFVADVARPEDLRGAAGTLLEGYEASFTRFPTLPDSIAPTGAGRLLLPMEESPGSGVAVATDSSVLLTIEITGIDDPEARDELVRRLLGDTTGPLH